MSQRFHSTKNPAEHVGLKEAVLRSLPADNGLYMPENLEPLPSTFWENWRSWDFPRLSFEIAAHFFQDTVPREILEKMVAETVNFPAPVVTPENSEISLLELFHGPTLAFKDFGARFMARLMAWLTENDDQELTVLVATSGDTGGAVASAFHKVPGTRVIILYPKGKVSGLQEKQLTTLGHNITALEIDGTFDDCQACVKAAFLNRELSARLNLTSANSINISRLLPQAFYYFEAARQLAEKTDALPVFVVPSGNFGNLTAGLLAARMGLPVKHFVAATNLNDVVPAYLRDGKYLPRPSVATISNAMDVGSPSNFARLAYLFENDWHTMTEAVSGFAFTDEETRETIRRVAAETGYQLDPHGAVGWLAAEVWLAAHLGDQTIVLETAHPAKFLDTMEAELGKGSVAVPERLAALADLEKISTSLPADPQGFIGLLQEEAAS